MPHLEIIEVTGNQKTHLIGRDKNNNIFKLTNIGEWTQININELFEILKNN